MVWLHGLQAVSTSVFPVPASHPSVPAVALVLHLPQSKFNFQDCLHRLFIFAHPANSLFVRVFNIVLKTTVTTNFLRSRPNFLIKVTNQSHKHFDWNAPILIMWLIFSVFVQTAIWRHICDEILFVKVVPFILKA